MVPGLIGGADWAGAAADPKRSVLYVPSHTLPSVARLGPSRGRHSRYAAYTDERVRGPRGLPLTKPPYGRITAINMRTGDHLWVRALGSGPVNHPALQGLDLPDLGWGVRSFVLATPTLLLAASQDPREDGGRYGRKRRDRAWIEAEPLLRAFSPHTGKPVGQVLLPDNPHGNLMSYMAAGRQYIVVPIGQGRRPPELIGLALTD